MGKVFPFVLTSRPFSIASSYDGLDDFIFCSFSCPRLNIYLLDTSHRLTSNISSLFHSSYVTRFPLWHKNSFLDIRLFISLSFSFTRLISIASLNLFLTCILFFLNFSLVTNTYYIQHDLHRRERKISREERSGECREKWGRWNADEPSFWGLVLIFRPFFPRRVGFNRPRWRFVDILTSAPCSALYVWANRCLCFLTKSMATLSPTLVSRIWRIGWSETEIESDWLLTNTKLRRNFQWY